MAVMAERTWVLATVHRDLRGRWRYHRRPVAVVPRRHPLERRPADHLPTAQVNPPASVVGELHAEMVRGSEAHRFERNPDTPGRYGGGGDQSCSPSPRGSGGSSSRSTDPSGSLPSPHSSQPRT